MGYIADGAPLLHPVGDHRGNLAAAVKDCVDSAGQLPVTATGSSTARTAAARAADVVNAADFLPTPYVTDGSVDYTTQIQAAITRADTFTPRVAAIYLPAGKFLYTTLTNPIGHAFIGPGSLVTVTGAPQPLTGGQWQTSSYADIDKYVFGTEYLSAFHNGFIANPISVKTIVFSGDSTTLGVGLSTGYDLTSAVTFIGRLRGAHILAGVNRGQSGKTTSDWVTTYLAGDLAAAPLALVLRWGVNDPAQGRTLDQFAADLRSGLATIRASKTLAQLSIILCTPNSTSDTPNARDERWYEQVTPIIRQAARDYQAVFVDVYGYLRDSRHATDWMDDPYADGRHIHPTNVMSLWIAGLISDVLFPSALEKVTGGGRVMNVYNSEGMPLAADLPNNAEYLRTVSLWRATPGNGFPADGALLNFRTMDELSLQINWGYGSTSSNPQFRQSAGGGTTWTPWVRFQRLGVSADRGDADQTLVAGVDAPTQLWATTLTANRTVTLSTTGVQVGDTFRVVRTGLGAFTLNVGGLKTIPSATAAFVDVAYAPSGVWVLTGYGTL